MSDFPYQGRLDSCCFCFNLKSGAKIIAFLTWFYCSIQLMAYLVTLVQIETHMPKCYPMSVEQSEEILVHSCFQDSIWIGEACKCVRAMVFFRCVHYFIGFLGSLLLLKGIAQRSPNLFNFWLIYAFIAIGINFLGFGSFRNPQESFSKLVTCSILIYFTCVIKFYQKQIRMENAGNLPVATISRPEDMHTVIAGTSATEPKDSPPPYSMVSPPPYTEVKPVDSNDNTAPPPPYSEIEPSDRVEQVNLAPTTENSDEATTRPGSPSTTNVSNASASANP